jgi:hypothetical protein
VLLVLLMPCRSAELVAAQRLEAAERRKMEEKERRLKQVSVLDFNAANTLASLPILTSAAG